MNSHRHTFALPIRLAAGMSLVMMLTLTTSGQPTPVRPARGLTATVQLTTNTPARDPLASLMVPQPPVDTTSPIVPVVEFEPAVITNGQSAVYRVVLNVMESSIDWPDRIPAPPGCSVRPGAFGQRLRNAGGRIVPRTTFLYHIQPSSNGVFTLPGYTIRARNETVQIPAAHLTVVPAGSAQVQTAPRILMQAPEAEVFVGQNIDLQVLFPGKPDGAVQTLTQVEVNGDGVLVDRNFRTQRIETRMEAGRPIRMFSYDAMITPMRAGRTELIAQGYTVGTRTQERVVTSAGVRIVLGQPVYKLVDSEPLALNILPLPRASRPPGFTGAIGTFTLDPPILSTNRITSGDLLTLTVTLRGTGNLERVLPPEIPESPQWQVFQARKDNTLAAIIRQREFITFDYRLIPLDETLDATPEIPFSYFDPESKSYVSLNVPPVPLTVDPSPTELSATDPGSVVQTRSLLLDLLKTPEDPTALADTLYAPGRTSDTLRPAHQSIRFVVVQFVPAILLAGVWIWDRRRRFLLAHPEIVLRNRARKAIRKHARRARRAAARKDASAFLNHAIQGFREACAPVAPAEPDALVCEDILTALPDAFRSTRTEQVIQQLFTSANEWQFGDQQPDSQELLQLAEEVDRDLGELRAKL